MDMRTPSQVLEQVISETVVKELGKSGIAGKLILSMLKEHNKVSELLEEILTKPQSGKD